MKQPFQRLLLYPPFSSVSIAHSKEAWVKSQTLNARERASNTTTYT